METKAYRVPNRIPWREPDSISEWSEFVFLLLELSKFINAISESSALSDFVYHWKTVRDDFMKNGTIERELFFEGGFSENVKLNILKEEYTFDTSSGFKTVLQKVSARIETDFGRLDLISETENENDSILNAKTSTEIHSKIEKHLRENPS